MTEQDVINYMRKCTAILLTKMDQLSTKIHRLEMLLLPDNSFFFIPTKRYIAQLEANEKVEITIERDLEELRKEFYDILTQMKH